MQVDKYILCESVAAKLSSGFCENGWITLFQNTPVHVFSYLVDDEKVDMVLKNTSWDLCMSNTGPLINETDGVFLSYQRYYENGIEPLVLIHETRGRFIQMVDIIEELVMYFDLRKEIEAKDKYTYYQVDESGEDVKICVYDGNHFLMRIDYLKEFLAIKQMSMVIAMEYLVHSSMTILDLHGIEHPFVQEQFDNIVLEHSLMQEPMINHGYQTFSILRGKYIYRHDANDIKHLWGPKDNGYEDYQICDENGNICSITCEEDKVPNLFNRKGNEPYSLTPVFFQREVLKKYYSNSIEYHVFDGGVYAKEWSTYLDNDRMDDYVVVPLKDLGKLPHRVQLYWKSYNVIPIPGTTYSMTALQRWFAGCPCDPQYAVDLILRKRFYDVNDKWQKVNGWPLLLPLAKGDEYHVCSIHRMFERNNDQEFDDLVLSIVKIFIDSLNEKELVKHTLETDDVITYLKSKDCDAASALRGGIAKLECFLISQGATCDEDIHFLQQLQRLRSSSIAHRKSTDLSKDQKKAYDYFQRNIKSDQEVMDNIMWRLIKWLERVI